VAALRQLHGGTWISAEVVDVFEYLRDRPLHLTGFDCQVTSGDYAEALRSKVAAAGADSTDLELVTAWIPTLRNQDAPTHASGIAAAKRLLSELESRPDAELAAQAVRDALVSAEYFHGIKAWLAGAERAQETGMPRLDFRDPRLLQVSSLRDRHMAGNMARLLNSVYAGRKIVCWLENFHAARGLDAVHPGLVTLGAELHQRLGDAVYSVGMFSHSVGGKSPAPAGSLEERLHRRGQPSVFVDLRARPREVLSGELHGTVGVAPSLGGVGRIVVDWGTVFDGLVFIDETWVRHEVTASVAEAEG
jgi:erythromycin esterase-like protein